MDLCLDAFGGTTVARIAEYGAQGVANSADRQLIPEELPSRAGDDDSLGVGVLVGALGEDQQRIAKGQSPESRSRATVGDDGVATWQQHTLRVYW